MSVNTLAEKLALCPPAGSRWVHYKGGHYQVVGSAICERTLEPQVVYYSLKDHVTFCRGLRDWQSHVLAPGGVGLLPRFRPVEQGEGPPRP